MNLEPDKNPMKQFIEDNNLYNLIKKPTCFKSSNGKCIDLILTNKKSCATHLRKKSSVQKTDGGSYCPPPPPV